VPHERYRGAAAFAAVALAWVFLAGPAAATPNNVGAGVGSSPIVLARVATPGSSEQLPELYVVNTGTLPSAYRLRVEELAPSQGLAVPPDWVNFASNDFELAPKASTSVKMTLNVPPGAHTGRYVSDLIAGTVAAQRTSGVIPSAQAATKIMFTVGPASGGSSWALPWWAYLAIAVVVGLAGVLAIQRRYGFRLRVERRE
jgi:uncharacterized membrane protein